MNYRICDGCRKIYYATGKSYEDEFGEIAALVILKGISPSTLETKGLCPFCNPKSQYFIEGHQVYANN